MKSSHFVTFLYILRFLGLKTFLHKSESQSSRKIPEVLVLNSHDHNIVNLKEVDLE